MRRLTAYLCLGFAAAFGAPAKPARAGEATDRLRSVVTLAREGSWDAAVKAIPDVSIVDRTDSPALQEAAAALRTQRPAESSHLWAALRRFDPDAVRPRTALESIWAQAPSMDGIWSSDLDLSPVDYKRSAYGALTVVTLSVKPFEKAAPALEPSTGAPFAALVNVYGEVNGRLRLRFIVHAETLDRQDRARQIGCYLAALSDLTDPMLGASNRAQYPVPVWLEGGGSPGARQWNGAITIQAVGHARTDAEWVRELSHEWGHACLPGIDGFSRPEAWANGDLGERIFVRLMRQSGRLDAWNAGTDVSAYQAKFVDAPLNAFAASGPNPKLLDDRGQAGYDQFLVQALYIYQAYGADLLVKALDAAEGGSAREFYAEVCEVLARLPSVRITHIGSPGPRPICIPRSGRYSLDGLHVRRNGRAIDGPVHLDQGWTELEWEGELSLRHAGTSGAPSTRNR